MEQPPSKMTAERRTAWLLVAVLLAQLIMLSLQAPAEGVGSNLLESAVLRLVMPLARGVDVAAGGASGLTERFRRQRQLVIENRGLRAEVERLRLEVMRLSRYRSDLERLAEAVGYPVPPGYTLAPADVAYVDYASWLRTLVLYAGDLPVEVNQPVVSSSGLVGRVIAAAPPWARVQLLTDRAAAVGAMLESTRRQGVVRSGADGKPYLSDNAQLVVDAHFAPIDDVRALDAALRRIPGVVDTGLFLGMATHVFVSEPDRVVELGS